MWLGCAGREARLREREGGPGSRRGRSAQTATWHNFTGGGGACKAALGQHGVFLGVSEPRARTESRDSVYQWIGKNAEAELPP